MQNEKSKIRLQVSMVVYQIPQISNETSAEHFKAEWIENAEIAAQHSCNRVVFWQERINHGSTPIITDVKEEPSISRELPI